MGLFYRLEGNGDPKRVFLHGFLESSGMWEYLRLRSLPGTNVFIDLPGHGKSELGDVDNPSMNAMMEEVLVVLDQLQIDKYHLVGHSMGGYVAIELKKHDSRCKKVILLNSNFWADSAEKKNDRLRVAEIVMTAKRKFLQESIPGLFLKPVERKEEIASLLEEADQMEESAIAYASLAMRSRDNNKQLLIDHLKDFLIIQGKEDAVVPIDQMRSELGELPVALEVLSPCGHMAHIEQSDLVLSLMNGFLS